jgi:hypothetical protein
MNVKTLIDSPYATNEQREQAQEQLPALNNPISQGKTLAYTKEDRAHELGNIQQSILDLDDLILAGTQSGLNQLPRRQKKRKRVEDPIPHSKSADNDLQPPLRRTKRRTAT